MITFIQENTSQLVSLREKKKNTEIYIKDLKNLPGLIEKTLLYDNGYTVKGVQKLLKENDNKYNEKNVIKEKLSSILKDIDNIIKKFDAGLTFNINSKKEFKDNYLNSITLFNADDKLKLYNSHNENIVNNNLLGKDFQSIEIFLNSFEKVEHLDRLNQVLAIDCQFLLPGNNLVKPDRMGMAASIEARTPFLDYRVVEESFLVPGEYKLNNDITKFILKEIAKKYLPKQIISRPTAPCPISTILVKPKWLACARQLRQHASTPMPTIFNG